MIQKGLDLRCEQSVAVWALGAVNALGILPRRLHGHCGASVVTARDAVAPRMEDPDETHRYPVGAAFRGRAAGGRHLSNWPQAQGQRGTKGARQAAYRPPDR